MTERPSDLPLACDMGVFTEAERSHHTVLIERVLSACEQRRETDDGYRFEFSGDLIYPSLTEWIALEHRCCPFLTFGVGLGPGTLSLDLSGPPGVKQFLRSELGLDDLLQS